MQEYDAVNLFVFLTDLSLRKTYIEILLVKVQVLNYTKASTDMHI